MFCWVACLTAVLLSGCGERAGGADLKSAVEKGDVNEVQRILKRNPASLQAVEGGEGVLLQTAISSGNLELVKILTEGGVSVDPGSIESAVRGGKDQILECLLAQPNVDFKDGNAFLLLAPDAGVIRVLIKHGAQLESRTGANGDTPLLLASKAGRVDVVNALIAEGADVTATDKNGWTALAYAASPQVAEALVHGGAKVGGETTPQGLHKLPLILAIMQGRKDLVEYLLSAGADPTEKQSDGASAFEAAAGFNRAELLETLASHASNLSREKIQENFAEAIYAGNLEVAQAFLKKGAEVNGGTIPPLFRAVGSGKSGMVRFLLDQGADPKVRDSEGNPLLCTVVDPPIDRDKLRLAAGAPDNVAKLYAPFNEMLQLLLEKGASVSETNKKMQTPLHLAASEENPPSVKLLLEHGADVRTLDQFGATPLHYAVMNGRLESAQLLCEKGADVSVPLKDGVWMEFRDKLGQIGNEQNEGKEMTPLRLAASPAMRALLKPYAPAKTP